MRLISPSPALRIPFRSMPSGARPRKPKQNPLEYSVRPRFISISLPAASTLNWQSFETMTGLLSIVVAYLIGSVPFGYLLVKFTTGKDVRSEGSGNIGATNVLRSTGRVAAVATLVLDIAKGFAAVWLAGYLTNDSPEWTSAAALAVMAGHAFPIFLKFQGGKAVASF